MVVGLPADAAADAELPHHLEDRLVRYPRAQLGPQAHRYFLLYTSLGGLTPVEFRKRLLKAS